jgi:RNA-directed DNA polymerase
VVQGAGKIIWEASFEADFGSNADGYRPKRSPHQALAEVRRRLLRRMFTVIEVDLSAFFDSIRHHILLAKMARRVPDAQVVALVKKILTATGSIGVPQGGTFSPLAANISLHDLDWHFERRRQHTADGPDDAMNDHRCADDILILVRQHWRKRWMESWVQAQLCQPLAPLQVQVNADKTRVVTTLQGEAFSLLGFDVRRVLHRRQQPYVRLTPRKKARLAIKAEIRPIMRESGAQPVPAIIQRLNPLLAGWGHDFRVANANRACGEGRDDVEMKVRTRLSRRKRRRQRSTGWKRWRHEYLYSVLGRYWDWTLQPLKSVEAYRRKCLPPRAAHPALRRTPRGERLEGKPHEQFRGGGPGNVPWTGS